MGELSEMAQIRNLHWWTVEYGLIGTLENPKIYGAGLLSSIGESTWCMQKQVKKLPYTIDTATINFDITKPQPQLFVTPNFAHLSLVLNEFANTMAMRKGGIKGVRKLINSENLGTIELTTGIQISGIFTKVIEHMNKVAYFQTIGPTALANRDKELISHGITNHAKGFGSPVGKLKGINLPIEDMSPRDLKAYGIYEGEQKTLEFKSGIVIRGRVITGTRDLRGKILIISFDNCTVTHKDEILFESDWGIYDMVIGKAVVSTYAGPADVNSFLELGKVSETKTPKISYSNKEQLLNKLYAEVKNMREENTSTNKKITEIFNQLKTQFQLDWLLILELYELALQNNYPIKFAILEKLEQLKNNKSFTKLIENGLVLCKKH